VQKDREGNEESGEGTRRATRYASTIAATWYTKKVTSRMTSARAASAVSSESIDFEPPSRSRPAATIARTVGIAQTTPRRVRPA
jgi:hypothetical protein